MPGYIFYWAEDAGVSNNIEFTVDPSLTNQYVANQCNANGACTAFEIVADSGGAYCLKNGDITIYDKSFDTRYSSSSIYGLYVKGRWVYYWVG